MRHPVALGICVAVMAFTLAACSTTSPTSVMPRLRGMPSDERPPWLRDLPEQLERYPAPQGWGGDHLAQTGRPGSLAA